MLYGIEDISRDLLHLPNTSDKLRKDEFWAVDDVSFEVKRGECLGIIGRNGAGKSTLLKMLNGIILPDKGKITIKGKVGALIEVGAGFHPMLTGRENIYVNGAILGMNKREIDQKFDEIVAFAELEEFIDMPVKHYSSGMYARLGFSIAARFNPNALLVDEALAVGDLAFSIRCLNRIAELRKNGTAVLFVSHNELQVRGAAQQCLLLHNGTCKRYNDLDEAFLAYNIQQSSRLLTNGTDIGFVHEGPIKVVAIEITSPTIDRLPRTGEDLIINLDCQAEQYFEKAGLEIRFWNATGELITNVRSITKGQTFNLVKGINRFQIEIKSIPLVPGCYRIAGGFLYNGEILGWARDLAYIDIACPKTNWLGNGMVMLNAKFNKK